MSTVKEELGHIDFVMKTHIQKDVNAITKNIKNLSPDKIRDNISAFKDVYHNDYAQLIMKELTKNPLLNKLITQEDTNLSILIEGTKYDLDQWINNQVDIYIDAVAEQITTIEKEHWWQKLFP